MRTWTLGLACVGLLAGACKKENKNPEPSPTGSGSDQGSATPVEAAKRPSQDPSLLPPLPKLDLPADAKRKEKITLGNVLFFDKRLSGANDRACYSCHLNEDGTGGHDPLANGSGNKTLTRHAPMLWNVGYWKSSFYWDGRAKTLEANVKGAWGGGNMGGSPDFKNEATTQAALDKRAGELAAMPEYKKLFADAFPDAKQIKAEQVQSALAEYMRTMVCEDTPYDKYVGGDKKALDEQQQRGLDIFLGKGKCQTCHLPPYFSSAMAVDGGAYFNVGIGTQGVADDKIDVGRMKVTNQPGDWAAFKPPSLRNVAKSPPYFHDGSVAKLEDAVKLMSAGGIANKNKNPLAEDRKLSDAELADLTAFLRGLDCGGKLEEVKAEGKDAPPKDEKKDDKKDGKKSG